MSPAQQKLLMLIVVGLGVGSEFWRLGFGIEEGREAVDVEGVRKSISFFVLFSASLRRRTASSNPERDKDPGFENNTVAFFSFQSTFLSSVKNVVTLREHIEQLSTVYANLTAIKGSADTEILFSKSLFFISIGSNDLLSYYHSNTSLPKQEFLSALEHEYEKHLKNLLKLGARKIGIISVTPVGCCPSQRVYNESEVCLESLNDLSLDFLPTTKAFLMKLSSEYTVLKYSLGITFEMTINVIANPLLFGFKEVQTACCGVKRSAKLMGFKRSPLTFFGLAANPKLLKRACFRGVNFASGGSGILDNTGQTTQLSTVELTIPKSSKHLSGFKEVQTACCGVKRFNGEGICDNKSNLCSNRHEYLFWDLFHPTMAASKLAALTLYAGEPRFVSPINFKQLAEA
ncbi:unnamed protein product [Dovyalis caffra]|uniref:Uncharacterized protein n=1 Tax=Dovyalis caffra TaxID=77055 RepID=A0AAV1R663_9ROSI|nr:unnamed protein product [Dovyalis caffra]